MKNKMYIFNRVKSWIYNNSINGQGISVTSKQQIIYPEVTGYYIPTLLEWGERDLAISYTRYLCSIQKEDGSWYDSNDIAPYVFDSAQILKGLISIRDIIPEVDEHIIKGCDWLLSNVNEAGRLITPSKDAWGDDETFCSELIHLYCLKPLVDSSIIFNKTEYKIKADKIKNYYLEHYKDKILNFCLFSHFYAYVLEGLLDMGEREIVIMAMNNIEKYQNKKGGIPGLPDVKWVCSTGMFQLALVWYKLGDLKRGNRIFDYACSLQNESGGWYGSYQISILGGLMRGRKKAYYFPHEEISWANKYFLDALAYKERLEFELQAESFGNEIEINDGRYQLVEEQLKEQMKMTDLPNGILVCDIGCGKGRYLKNLLKVFPQNTYYGMDISETVMRQIDSVVQKRVGRLTNIPFEENYFDFVYVCEALEHAVNIEGAFRELYRIIKKGGTLLIIDKPVEKLGKLELDEWEQWIDDSRIQNLTKGCGGNLQIVTSVSYDNNKNDGLFRAWIIKK